MKNKGSCATTFAIGCEVDALATALSEDPSLHVRSAAAVPGPTVELRFGVGSLEPGECQSGMFRRVWVSLT